MATASMDSNYMSQRAKWGGVGVLAVKIIWLLEFCSIAYRLVAESLETPSVDTLVIEFFALTFGSWIIYTLWWTMFGLPADFTPLPISFFGFDAFKRNLKKE